MSSNHDVLEALRRLEGNLYERLSADFKSEIGQFRLEVNGRFDAIEVRLDRLEQEYQMLVAVASCVHGPGRPAVGGAGRRGKIEAGLIHD